MVLIHGVNTVAPWFAPTKRALERFFRVELLPHEVYRKNGTRRLVWEPTHHAVSASAVLAVPALSMFGLLPLAGALALSAAFLGSLGHLNARVLLRDETNRVAKELHSRGLARPTRPVHVLAHSLGSFFIGQTLERFGHYSFARVVFVGCVLSRRYGWSQVTQTRQVQSVRNEVGLQDDVPLVAMALGFLRLPFGSAGRSGFLNRDGVVHTVKASQKRCESCVTSPAPVHNVVSRDIAHSDLLNGHVAERVWLPYYLGFDPGEWAEVLHLCVSIRELRDAKKLEEAAEKEAELANTTWIWLRSQKTLGAFLRSQVSKSLPRLKGDRKMVETYSKDALFRFCVAVVNFARELENPRGSTTLPYATNLVEVARLAAKQAARA